MTDPIIKAKELGSSIIQSEEYTIFQRCKLIVEEQGLSLKLPAIEQAKLVMEAERFPTDSKLYKDASEIIEECNRYPALCDYFEAKEKLSLLLNAVNDTLSYITGMDSGKGNCGGCSGCSGCKK